MLGKAITVAWFELVIGVVYHCMVHEAKLKYLGTLYQGACLAHSEGSDFSPPSQIQQAGLTL
jgi:hypothetical protein